MRTNRIAWAFAAATATVLGAMNAQAALIAKYTFNESGGSTVHDVSGVGTPANGTLVDGASLAGDGFLSLDGISGYVNFGHPSKLTNIPNGFTIEAWVVNAQEGVPGSEPMIFGQDTSGVALTKYYNTFAGYATPGPGTDAAEFNVLNKMLVTVTYDFPSNVISIYRNGIPSNSRTLSLSSFNASSALDFLVGANAGKTKFLSGKIDEISFYDNGLSEAQVAANYALGTDVPEPATLSLLGVCTTVFIRRRR